MSQPSLPASNPAPSQAASYGRLLVTASIIMVAGLLWSGWHPYDRATWVMEVVPVMVVLPLLWATQRSYPLTTLLLVLVTLHALVLILGGAYTYARVPLGFAMQEWWQLSRNPYDKIGHFFQGFVPAIAAREILLRGAHVQGRKMLAVIVMCVVLAISAGYELIEWAARRAGVNFPDGSAAQIDATTPMSVAEALRTPGALLFRAGNPPTTPHHIAISLGDGRTIEARNSRAGVGVFSAHGRGWTRAGTIPGMR